MMLKEKVRNVIRNSGADGLFASEVADRLELTEKAVSSTLHALSIEGVVRRDKLYNDAHNRLCWRYWFIEPGQNRLPLGPHTEEPPKPIEASVPWPFKAPQETDEHVVVDAEYSAKKRVMRIEIPMGDFQTARLTFAEAKALYDVLHVMFGAK